MLDPGKYFLMLGYRVSVVVPAYNEARQIQAVLESMPSWVGRVIVVDDASADGTDARVRDHQASGSKPGGPVVVLLSHPQNLGVGAAIRTGYRYCLAEQLETEPLGAGEIVVVMGGDGQMLPEDLPGLLEPIAAGQADYVKGNRFASESIRAMPLGRYLGGQVFSRLTSLASGLSIHDSQCGYTAIRIETLAALDLDKMWPQFGYPNDLLCSLAAARFRVAEVPVQARYHHNDSKLRLRHLPAIFFVLGRGFSRRVRS
jgi:glycosyltransferase involved in cell wall biosynthesis